MQMNPVIEKELKVKMRGWKAPTLITVYLCFLGLVIFLIFLNSQMQAPYGGQFNPRTALNAYNVLAIFQLLLLVFITPAMTGSAISGERERQTLDLLLCTNISPFSIVIGKIFVSIAHIMLLITASLPVMATVFLYGGIRITDLLLLFGFFLVTALMLGSMGIFYSTIFKKSSVSMILSYMTVLGLLFGTIIAFGLYSSMYVRYNQKAPEYSHMLYFLFANPMFGFGSVTEGMSSGVMNIGSIFGIYPGRYGIQPTTPGNTSWIMNVKPWMANITFDVVLSLLFIFISAWKIKPVKRLWFRKKQKQPKVQVQEQGTV